MHSVRYKLEKIPKEVIVWERMEETFTGLRVKANEYIAEDQLPIIITNQMMKIIKSILAVSRK
jgi:hypothetical protein